ncbi:phosphonate metabolim protein, transferase hexapeptide repeat family [Desulfocapsa sulfexigens DSM 10523]|uniref:Phosphonate metabolim protein, transferase hexapeptide repeat family n=1 Tax=Desulfocapsa sulfexigens (strain DSM 10523 / SB164P1) TaxID=1167006 RepID=M1P8W7_DESSD|nr:DapH/DapD/GlmU-related protein [Desulfocapsa sulfexigens]AGF78097.1 phosphonate metabolim protein, transferase hexapeptide repeat family [Desulfocapsa sulfexigens DSM 10523]
MVYIKSHNPDPEITLGSFPLISEKARVRSAELGRYTELRDHVEFVESSLGDYSYVMERSSIVYSTIGKFVNIASDVRINPGNHPMHWVSQHHIMYRRKQYGVAGSDDESFFAERRLRKVVIGHDVWIGHGATIMPGVSIGNGAIIGAGSVVTHDVAPYTIVAGVPEKEIRSRFRSSTRDAIERTCWWDWDHETIRERIDDFRDVDRFLALYGSR